MRRDELKRYRHRSKTEYYIRHGRRRWKDLYDTARHFLARTDLVGEKVLEVGCAAGGLSEILTQRYGRVSYTGMDVSRAEIVHARKTYPDATFVVGDFLQNRFKAEAFDTVCAFQVVNHQPEYRRFIREMFRVARKRVIFTARFQYTFPTVVDLDASFIYYHGSGRRAHFIPFNFYELFNYLHVELLRAKKISVYGYYTRLPTSAFVCMPRSKLVAGAFCVEKYPAGAKVERWGGRAEFANAAWCEHDLDLPGLTLKDI